MKTQRLCFNLQSICSFGNSLSFRCISPSVTPFVRSSLHSKSSLHSQSFTFGSFLLAVSSLIINSIQSVFTPQVHSFTQSFISKLIQSFSSLDYINIYRSRSHYRSDKNILTLTRSTSKACPIRSFTGNVQLYINV